MYSLLLLSQHMLSRVVCWVEYFCFLSIFVFSVLHSNQQQVKKKIYQKWISKELYIACTLTKVHTTHIYFLLALYLTIFIVWEIQKCINENIFSVQDLSCTFMRKYTLQIKIAYFYSIICLYVTLDHKTSCKGSLLINLNTWALHLAKIHLFEYLESEGAKKPNYWENRIYSCPNDVRSNAYY